MLNPLSHLPLLLSLLLLTSADHAASLEIRQTPAPTTTSTSTSLDPSQSSSNSLAIQSALASYASSLSAASATASVTTTHAGPAVATGGVGANGMAWGNVVGGLILGGVGLL
ncbi:hypothetical protein ACMFMG_005920 [Clarireedia jacksonii]